MPHWASIDEVIDELQGHKRLTKLCENFKQEWAKRIYDSDGRIQTLRVFYERQAESVKKMISLSQDMIDDKNKTLEFEN